jgi:hypothetical protein
VLDVVVPAPPEGEPVDVSTVARPSPHPAAATVAPSNKDRDRVLMGMTKRPILSGYHGSLVMP